MLRATSNGEWSYVNIKSKPTNLYSGIIKSFFLQAKIQRVFWYFHQLVHFIFGGRVVDAQFVYREENLGDGRRNKPRNAWKIFCSDIFVSQLGN